jgi:Flp pilus assembly pilin Flp
MRKLHSHVLGFLQDVTSIEYVLMASLIAVVIYIGVTDLRTALSGRYEAIADAVANALAGAKGGS